MIEILLTDELKVTAAKGTAIKKDIQKYGLIEASRRCPK